MNLKSFVYYNKYIHRAKNISILLHPICLISCVICVSLLRHKKCILKQTFNKSQPVYLERTEIFLRATATYILNLYYNTLIIILTLVVVFSLSTPIFGIS